jgi:predicted amidophosphoribosyltransferase
MITIICPKCGKSFPFQRHRKYCFICEDKIKSCRACGKHLETNFPFCFDHIIIGESSVYMANAFDRVLTIQ